MLKFCELTNSFPNLVHVMDLANKFTKFEYKVS